MKFKFVLLSIMLLIIISLGCQSNDVNIEFKHPERVILIISDAMPVGAPERIPLPVFQSLKTQGTYYKEMYVSPAAHPSRNDNINESSYYPWGCSLPNPVAMTGSLFIGRAGIKQQMIQHSYTDQITAFTVNCDSYEEISPGFDIYHQLEENGYPDLFKDEMPIEDAFKIIENDDPAFIRIHMQGPGSAGHITFMGKEAYYDSHLQFADKDGSILWFQNIWHPQSPYIYHALKADSLIGEFVNWLQETQRLQESIVIVMGDHGQWDKGTHPPYAEKSNKTPFLVMGKGIKKGVEFDYAEVLDLAPTITFLSGVPTPASAQGRVLEECMVGGPNDLPASRHLKELNQLLIDHHEFITNHSEWLNDPVFQTLNEQFLTIEQIGTWHQHATTVAELLNKNREIFDKLQHHQN